MGRSRVIIRRASYDYPALKPLIFEMADSLCGEVVRSRSRVVIKPNLLAPARPAVRNFKFPEMAPLVFGPRSLHGLMRRHLVQRPVPDGSLCRLCGECENYCPARAISSDEKRIHFDYDKCIRCYCCVEVCLHGALRAKEPLMGKAIRKLRKS